MKDWDFKRQSVGATVHHFGRPFRPEREEGEHSIGEERENLYE